jgi:hypothetical protein|tara:strand:+ start:5553 stop:5909 length:357 start_codon:yes stop_codon:yes gene_type:complete
VKYSGHVIDTGKLLIAISLEMRGRYCFMQDMRSNGWREIMIEVEFNSEEHLSALDSIRNLFKEAIEEGTDPDVFMEVCLSFALSYHLEFSDKESLDKFIESAKQNMRSPAELDEMICH